MLHPVGSRAPAVYWRRRLALLCAVLVLILITAWVLRPGGEKHPAAASASTTSQPRPSSADAALTSPSTPSSSVHKPSTSGHGTPSHSAAPASCVPSQLKVAAVAGQSSYQVGAQPVVMLQVTNSGPLPCVQNLADSQVELRVYNGESRVWGSHDCEVQPGTDLRVLAVSAAVRISITWSGLSSQPACAGTRQRVGAGTYTLYALLAGHEGTAAQFSIS